MTRRTLVLTALSMMVIMGIGYAGDNASQNKIDPQGERILKSMFDDVKDMSSGRIKATDDLELVPSDSTMQIPPTHWEISFVRPGKIRIQTSGNGSSLLASDGHMLRLPEGKGQFKETTAPDNLSDLMKTPVILTLNYFMFSMSHFSILDIFDNDTYDGLMQRARRLSLEEAEEIDGQPCDHVRLIVSGEVPPGFKQSIDNISDEREREAERRLYTNKRIALDFWITQGDRPLLKKVQSTEKFPEGGKASVKILFEQWELDVAVPDDLFLLKEIDQKE